MSADDNLTQARIAAERARASLNGTLADLQARMNPRTLARTAQDSLRATGTDISRRMVSTVKRNPAPIIGIGAVLVGLVARKLIKNRPKARARRATDIRPPRFPNQAGTMMPEEGPRHD